MTAKVHSKMKRRLRTIAGAVFSLLSLGVLTYISLTMFSDGRFTGLSNLSELLSPDSGEYVPEFYFDTGKNRVFADLNGSVASVGSLGIQVFGADGTETFREQFLMSAPTVCSAGNYAAAYDIGGTVVRVFTETGISASVDAEYPIVSVSINDKGWFCVGTQEDRGIKGAVTVYNSKGKKAYVFESASGYVLTARLSPDSSGIAVLTLTDSGSKITFLNLKSENADNTVELPGELILDISYQKDESLLAMSTDAVHIIDKTAAVTHLYNYESRQLSGYAIDNGLIALHLLDYSVGRQGRLVMLNGSGKILGELYTSSENISMSLKDRRLTVLWSDGLMFYDEELNQYPPDGDNTQAAGMADVLTLNSKTALAAGDYSARIFCMVTD